MTAGPDDDDCTDNDKGIIQAIRDCMGGEESGVEKREAD